jgi:hypothetical protein
VIVGRSFVEIPKSVPTGNAPGSYKGGGNADGYPEQRQDERFSQHHPIGRSAVVLPARRECRFHACGE